MKARHNALSTVALLIATLASLGLLTLIWLAIHYSDKRIWLAIGLLMALSPFALVWRLLQAERKKNREQL